MIMQIGSSFEENSRKQNQTGEGQTATFASLPSVLSECWGPQESPLARIFQQGVSRKGSAVAVNINWVHVWECKVKYLRDNL